MSVTRDQAEAAARTILGNNGIDVRGMLESTWACAYECGRKHPLGNSAMTMLNWHHEQAAAILDELAKLRAVAEAAEPFRDGENRETRSIDKHIRLDAALVEAGYPGKE